MIIILIQVLITDDQLIYNWKNRLLFTENVEILFMGNKFFVFINEIKS